MTDKQPIYAELPSPKFSRLFEGIPVITVVEHESMMRAFADATHALRAALAAPQHEPCKECGGTGGSKYPPHWCSECDGKGANSKAPRQEPNPFSLACEVLRIYGGGPHTVTAELDIAKPETLAGLKFLESVLKYAWSEGAKAAQPAPSGDAWKDGDTAALVNQLRDVAVQCRDTQQLRERIAQIVRPLADRVAPNGDAEQTYEHRYAIRQGHEIAASNAYFEARPDIDSIGRRKTFEAGFKSGWDAARKEGK